MSQAEAAKAGGPPSGARASWSAATPTSTATAAAAVLDRSHRLHKSAPTQTRTNTPTRAHPIHGSSFVCTHHPEFYTHAGESRDAFDRLMRESARAKAAGAPHARAWRPHNEDDNFYLRRARFVGGPGGRV